MAFVENLQKLSGPHFGGGGSSPQHPLGGHAGEVEDGSKQKADKAGGALSQSRPGERGEQQVDAQARKKGAEAGGHQPGEGPGLQPDGAVEGSPVEGNPQNCADEKGLHIAPEAYAGDAHPLPGEKKLDRTADEIGRAHV